MARAVALGARFAVEAAEQSVSQALARRAEAQAASAGGTGELKAVRARVRELAADLDTVVNTAHGTEIARAEHRLRLHSWPSTPSRSSASRGRPGGRVRSRGARAGDR